MESKLKRDHDDAQKLLALLSQQQQQAKKTFRVGIRYWQLYINCKVALLVLENPHLLKVLDNILFHKVFALLSLFVYS